MADESPVRAQKARADAAWEANSAWDAIYRDVYDFAIPHRRPGGAGKTKRVSDRLYDMTAPTSAMFLAGELQRLLFSKAPILETGPLAHQAIGDRGKEKLDRELEKIANFIYPFAQAGDLDTSTHEMCTDLGVGTGALIPMRGTPEQPIIHYAIPADEIAIKGDAFGRQSLISWKRTVERGALLEAFQRGNFSAEFKTRANDKPHDEVVLYQDFQRLPDGRWQFLAYVERECDEFIASEIYRTKPVAVVTYYRVPGELRGRGPVLLALPSIKTLNKAQELALKSAAINMLGIWGFRAGGTFNPDTVRVGPGEFWPMQSTGGILGPDAMRLDPASGRIDIAKLVIEGMQQQIRETMQDTRLEPYTGTPKSASEIASRLQQNARTHLGAFGRLWRECHPVLVPRWCEILYSFGYLPKLMDFNQLMISTVVRSPMTAALQADEMANLAQYIELMTAFVGPQKLPMHLHEDRASKRFGEGLQIDRELIPTDDERKALRDQQAAEQEQAIAAEAAVKAAPNIVDRGFEMVQGEAA